MRRHVGSVANATGYVALHRHPRALEVCKIIAAEVQTSLGPRITPTLLAMSEFANGTTIANSNRTTPRIYPSFPPPFRGATFPEITDATRLLAAHRARVAEEAGGLIPVDPLRGGVEESLQKDHRRLIDHLLALGYVQPDEANDRFRYTWKGAILVGGNLLPWIKRARLAAERRRARRHLARLGLRAERGPAATTG